MRIRFERFFKHRKNLALIILLLAIFMLVFVMPKIFFSLDSNAKKMFWAALLFSGGIFLFMLNPKQGKDQASKEKSESPQNYRAYQQLLDEIAHCSYELKKQKQWAIGCLFMGWIVLWIGRWAEYPPYNHPMFAIPVFAIAFLAATKSWEKETTLDMSIVKSTLEGIELEKKLPGLGSNYFQDFAHSYTGWGMWRFVFVRISPSLMILFSLLSTGPIFLLADYLSKFVPNWIVYSSSGAIFALVGLFFAKTVCQPYQWLLWKLNASTT